MEESCRHISKRTSLAKGADNLEHTELGVLTAGAHLQNLCDEVSLYDAVLKLLIEEIKDDPTLVLQTSSEDYLRSHLSKGTDLTDSLSKATSRTTDVGYAIELYEKIQNLTQNTKSIDESTARTVIELVDDALKEFGTTNHEKKVEL